jgi:hypothetical protein
VPVQATGGKVNVEQIIQHENGELDEADEVKMFQDAINSGMAWKMQGSYGRQAMSMIEAGLCMLGEVGHKDYYGNYVPSRYEVKAGTKGSAEYCQKMQEV